VKYIILKSHLLHKFSLAILILSLISCGGGGTGGGADPKENIESNSGKLDSQFSGGGFVLFNSGFKVFNDDSGNAVKLDTSGRILVTGYTHNALGNFDIILARFTSNGEIDTTFGVDHRIMGVRDGIKDGFSVYDSATGDFRSDEGFDLLLDSFGRILVVGHLANGGPTGDMFILRYSADGIPDTSFGINGVVIHNSAAQGNADDVAHDVAIDRNNRIVVVGRSTNASGNYDMTVWRYLPDGDIDTDFGIDYDADEIKDGIYIHNNAAGGDGSDSAAAVVIDKNDRILVTGSSKGTGTPVNFGDDDLILWGLTDTGILDSTFGADYDNDGNIDGYFKYGSLTSYDTSSDIILDSSGNIIVVGSSYSADSNYDVTLFSFTNNGTLNTSFGVDYDSDGTRDGFVKNVVAGDQVARTVKIDTNGKLVIAGWVGLYEMAIWRYESNGDIDISFANNGISLPSRGRAHDMEIDVNGKFVLVGANPTGGNAAFDLALWRVLP